MPTSNGLITTDLGGGATKYEYLVTLPILSSETNAVSNSKVMVNGDTLFTLTGDIRIINLVSECISANDGTLTTIQYSITPTIGSATAISGVSASLASLAAGSIITVVGDALATAPVISTTGVGLAQTARGIYAPTGSIKIVVAVGSTTGTWRHYLRYTPLEPGAIAY